ncbi:hypothetical protein ACFE04_028790 [Oxalis oulophora]
MGRYALIQFQCALLLVVIAYSMPESSIFPKEPYSILFVSNLTMNEQLDIHLKVNHITTALSLTKFGQSFEFTIGFNIVGTCDFWYPMNHQHHVNFKGFEPNKEFISKCGGRVCIWTATYEGIYLTNSVKNENVFMYKWGS